MSILGVRGSSSHLSELKQSGDFRLNAHNTSEVGCRQLAASYLNDDFSTSPLPGLAVDPPTQSNNAQRLAARWKRKSIPWFWLVRKNIGAAEPQVAICGHHTAGSLYKRKSHIWKLEFFKKVYTMFRFFDKHNTTQKTMQINNRWRVAIHRSFFSYSNPPICFKVN